MEKEKQIKGDIIKLKEKYVLKHMEDDRKKKSENTEQSREKARSKKWEEVIAEDVDTEEVYWLNLDEWKVKRKEENVEGLWGM